jgi:hypothetical protein
MNLVTGRMSVYEVGDRAWLAAISRQRKQMKETHTRAQDFNVKASEF